MGVQVRVAVSVSLKVGVGDAGGSTQPPLTVKAVHITLSAVMGWPGQRARS